MAPALAEAITDATVSNDVYVPGHSAVQVQMDVGNTQCWMQVARSSLCNHNFSPHQAHLAELQAVASWNEVNKDDTVDNLYVIWSGLWEAYLRQAYQHRETRQQLKGVITAPRLQSSSPLVPPQSLPMRRLANFLCRLRSLRVQLRKGDPGSRKLWHHIAVGARYFAEMYGVPPIQDALHDQPQQVALPVLDQTHEFYNKVWRQEHLHQKQAARTGFREALAAHSGVNKLTAKLLKGTEAALPILQEGDRIFSKPKEVVNKVSQTWADEYFAKPEKILEPDWLAQQAPHQPAPLEPIPPIDGQMLEKAIRSKNKHTSPGVDDWHMTELDKLPRAALDGLAFILNEAERQGSLPRSMCDAWMALIPKNAGPNKALSIRAISVLSTIYRSYGALRATQMQGWANRVFHRWQLAYIRGRSPAEALASLSVKIDNALWHASELHILSLDASKAFLSISRAQVRALLLGRGFPPQLAATVESLYEQGDVRMRYAGAVVSETPFRLQRGIHQGCPLSVLSFNVLMTPLCQRLETEVGLDTAIMFADDISLVASSREQLQRALREVLRHLQDLDIQVNAAKTQYWSSRPGEEPLIVNDQTVEAKEHFTILGMKYSPTMRDHEDKEQIVSRYREAAKVLAALTNDSSLQSQRHGSNHADLALPLPMELLP